MHIQKKNYFNQCIPKLSLGHVELISLLPIKKKKDTRCKMDKERHCGYWNCQGSFIPSLVPYRFPSKLQWRKPVPCPSQTSLLEKPTVNGVVLARLRLIDLMLESQCPEGVRHKDSTIVKHWSLCPNCGFRGTLRPALWRSYACMGQGPGTLLFIIISPLPNKGSGTWKKMQWKVP